jgi:hypothetical protein
MTALAPALPKLERLVPRLASDLDGEMIATVRAMGRVLAGAGLDRYDFVAALRPSPIQSRWRSGTERWGEPANGCRFNGAGRLSPKGTNFVADMSRLLVLEGEPSRRQAEWLRAIYAG